MLTLNQVNQIVEANAVNFNELILKTGQWNEVKDIMIKESEQSLLKELKSDESYQKDSPKEKAVEDLFNKHGYTKDVLEECGYDMLAVIRENIELIEECKGPMYPMMVFQFMMEMGYIEKTEENLVALEALGTMIGTAVTFKVLTDLALNKDFADLVGNTDEERFEYYSESVIEKNELQSDLVH